MAAVAPVVTDFGQVRVATWGPLDGGDTGNAVNISGYSRVVLVSGGTFADSDNVDVQGAALGLAGVAATAQDLETVTGAAVNFTAAESALELDTSNLDRLTLVVNAGGVAGPSAIIMFMVAWRGKGY